MLTFLDSLSDIWLEHWYSVGITRKLTIYNCFANLLGIIVQFSHGVYGGAVNSMVGFILLFHKSITWDDTKDGRISCFRRQEITLSTSGVFLGIVVLGIVYGVLFKGEHPVWLVCLNVLLFVLGTSGRILLINGKMQSQYIYVVREFVDLMVFIAMILLNLTKVSFWMRLGSIISSFIILFKSVINWSYKANEESRGKCHKKDDSACDR